jgi:hypothetical protein
VILALAFVLATMPTGAELYAPVLVERQRAIWPPAPEPWTIAGLIEQESCITLRHSKCWNPYAELKTHREYGFGMGQITVAYHPDGSERFNIFTELTTAHASLRDWKWEQRHDAGYQLTAIVEMTRAIWRRLNTDLGATNTDHWAFVLAAYNGGTGGLLQDRRLCRNTPGCDAKRWFGHVELTSVKSRVPQKGYGNRSWYEINRSHVKNVLTVRRAKYQRFWGCT